MFRPLIGSFKCFHCIDSAGYWRRKVLSLCNALSPAKMRRFFLNYPTNKEHSRIFAVSTCGAIWSFCEFFFSHVKCERFIYSTDIHMANVKPAIGCEKFYQWFSMQPVIQVEHRNWNCTDENGIQIVIIIIFEEFTCKLNGIVAEWNRWDVRMLHWLILIYWLCIVGTERQYCACLDRPVSTCSFVSRMNFGCDCCVSPRMLCTASEQRQMYIILNAKQLHFGHGKWSGLSLTFKS